MAKSGFIDVFTKQTKFYNYFCEMGKNFVVSSNKIKLLPRDINKTRQSISDDIFNEKSTFNVAS